MNVLLQLLLRGKVEEPKARQHDEHCVHPDRSGVEFQDEVEVAVGVEYRRQWYEVRRRCDAKLYNNIRHIVTCCWFT